MLYRNGFLASLCAFAPITIPGVLSSSPTLVNSYPVDAHVGLTTPPPNVELRKKRANAGYICGYDAYGPVTCNDHDLDCKGTIMPNGHAYQYCATPGVVNQEVYTTAVSDWFASSCPPSTICCGGSVPAIYTFLYTASGHPYKVTGFACYTADTTDIVNPDKNVLNPPKFSASLARLAASTSTTSSTSSTTSSTTSSSPAPSHTSHSTSSGRSTGAKIGIGAGVGAGVGIVLVCGIVYFCLRRREKKKQRVPEVAPSQAPYSPPMSYNQAQYYQHESTSPQWSPPPQWSPEQPGTSPKDYTNSAGYPMQVSPEAHPHELQGQANVPKAW